MRVDWPLFLVVLLVLSVNAEKKKKKKLSKWALVKEIGQNLTELTRKVQTLSNPVQIHVHGMDDYSIDSQTKADGKKEAMEETDDHTDEDMEQKGTHVHIHFNLPPYPGSSTHEQDVVKGDNNDTSMADEYTYATCKMRPMAGKTRHKVEGYVALRQKPSQPLEIKVDLKGFRLPKKHLYRPEDERFYHGLHVHEFADFENGCLSFGGHFNPEGTTHGGLLDDERHAGDWGNVVLDMRGNIRVSMTDAHATLFGPNSIIGRGIVIHERADDLGKGGTKASMTTGDAGGRLNCCVIAMTKGGPW